MALPTEILLQIIQEAAYDLPISEVLETRLVNSKSSYPAVDRREKSGKTKRITSEAAKVHELKSYLEIFDDEIILHEALYDFLDTKINKWSSFPPRFRRLYLLHQIREYKKNPTAFAEFTHQVLNDPVNSLNTDANKADMVEKIIDMYGWERSGDARWMFQRPAIRNGWLDWLPERIDTPQRDMVIALVCSAVKRNDAAELSRILSEYPRPQLHTFCNRWGMVPLHLVAMHGGKEATKILAENGFPRHYQLRYHYRYAMAVAAENGNKGAMEAWIETVPPRPTPPDPQCPAPDRLRYHHLAIFDDLCKAMRTVVRQRNMEMISFIEEKIPPTMPLHELRFEGAAVAIEYGWLDGLRYFLEVGGFDVNMQTDMFFAGLLNTALSHHWRGGSGALVRLLLEHGVNPNLDVDVREQRRWIKGTPLQRAIILGDVGSVRILAENGADVDAALPGRHSRANDIYNHPPLLLAMKKESAEMVEALLENGANPTCRTRFATVVVKTDDEAEATNAIWKGSTGEKTFYFVAIEQHLRRKEDKKGNKKRT
ncbi:ankyrin repeat-containing domain protein [Aspergillus keveii]|uniref:Ankyrin repeat-containing domain protein n=1 Tax=Aspergillus keveii TaxID=714993 RepID=A0ABR4FYA2_9EURO